jgi:hypothetical protein
LFFPDEDVTAIELVLFTYVEGLMGEGGVKYAKYKI